VIREGARFHGFAPPSTGPVAWLPIGIRDKKSNKFKESPPPADLFSMALLRRPSHSTTRPSKSAAALRSVAQPYASFSKIDGSHSFKNAVPGGFVDYEARKRHGGKIAFFNFELAKEMGLIPRDHAHRLNADLTDALLDTFALVVINEWDIENKRKFPKEDIKPNRYMATRYLQLQHPNKRGTTSGDGRGIWNGEFKSRGITWDVSSSGTGATCLSPAVAIEKKFFKTGDPKVCYGNGYNCVSDGFSTSLMSEIFHTNGIPTERTLVIIEFAGGSSINVRAAPNLLRPSHFFHHLKQGNREALKAAVDYFTARQVSNGEWNCIPGSTSAYKYFAEQMALTCWLDWDGDNILANGGIIDYGSVRQFGLFHSEYRYDDVDRYSTKLAEQRRNARYLIQTFAQIKNFLETGRRRNIRKFKKDPTIALFESNFQLCMDEFLLKKIGFDSQSRKTLLNQNRSEVTQFRRIYAHFERTQCQKGIRNVADGITSDAAFSMRECLRELPKYYLKDKNLFMEPESFLKMMKSSYAKKADLKITPYRLEKIREFQDRYVKLIEITAGKSIKRSSTIERVLLEITMRSSVINRQDRITGDGVMDVTEIILKMKKKWPQFELQLFFEKLVDYQLLDPSKEKSNSDAAKAHIREAIERVRQSLLDYRETV
jgi:uncharacterized protein YdiU (UPF0061 family)